MYVVCVIQSDCAVNSAHHQNLVDIHRAAWLSPVSSPSWVVVKWWLSYGDGKVMVMMVAVMVFVVVVFGGVFTLIDS